MPVATQSDHNGQSVPARLQAGADGPGPETGEPTRPFRLVKYFSLTGFSVILAFILLLTLFISSQGKELVLKKSTDYAQLLATNLNHQVFAQFVLPIALRFGQIRLREPEQNVLLDAVVRSTIHGFKVQRVDVYDLEGRLLYSTDQQRTAPPLAGHTAYEEAVRGQTSSELETATPAPLAFFDRTWILTTYFPFRAERPLQGAVDVVLGVFVITQDLTDDYTEIARFQFLSIGISLAFSVVLFFILRKILGRGESIMEQRNEERRRLEDRLHQAQRLASLGQMVATVSHEIRNPLGIICSTAQILENKVKTYDPKNRLAEVILEESKRLDGIVTEFLDFARPLEVRSVRCRIEDVLDKNLAFMAPTLEREHIEVVREYDGPEAIAADPDLLYRAFMNIFVNAVQAMPDGGKLIVATKAVSRPGGPDPSGIEVAITDTGEGIDPTVAQNLFTPFFTTKNRGTGLGLAIVKNIIDGHQGSVNFEPNPDGGTRLVIRLPSTGPDFSPNLVTRQ